jgi:hypothetical protein
MQIVGTADQASFPGPSLVKLWVAPEAQPDWPYPLAEHAEIGPKYEKMGTIRSLVSPRWHFIVSTAHGPELYDWLKDPRETNNLAMTPEGKSAARHFADRLQVLLSQPHWGNGGSDSGGSQQMR